MVIREKMNAKVLKIFSILAAFVVIVISCLTVSRFLPTYAADDIINIGTDLVIGSSGTNWSYDVSQYNEYNDLTITAPVTLTGEWNYTSDLRFRIVGNHTITFKDMTLNVKSAGAYNALTIKDASNIILTGKNTINSTSTNRERRGLHAYSPSEIFNIQSTTNGTLDINLSDGASSTNYGMEITNSQLYIYNTVINVTIGNSTATTSGIMTGVFSGKNLTVERGTLNVDNGTTSSGLNHGIRTHGRIILNTDGLVTSKVGGGGNSTSAIYHTYETFYVESSTGRYIWTASENKTGDPLITGTYPDDRFATQANYKYATLAHKPANVPVDVSVTSPASNQYINPNNGFEISGTIIDADDDTWDVGAALALAENSFVGTWWPCATNTTTRTFSCQYDGLSISDGNRYLHVRVSDFPSNGTTHATVKIIKIPVIVDTTPPKAPTINFGGSYVSGNVSDGPVFATITHGADTNVDKTTYSLNDGPEVELDITYPLVIRSSGIWDLKVFTYDKAGNKSPAATATVKVDLSPPSEPSIIFIGSTPTTGWSNTDIIFNITEGQDDTGVVKNTYTIGAGGEIEHDGSNITVSDEGEIDITAKSYDGAGRESSTTETVYIDKTAPTLSRDASGGTLVDGSTYTVSPTITLAGTDSLSGVKEIQYSWHEGMKYDSKDCTYSTIVDSDSVDTQIPSTYGLYTLCSRIVDNAGNISPTAIDPYALTDLRKVLIDPDTGISVETFGPEFMWHEKLVISKKQNDSYDFNTSKETLAVFSIEICSDLYGNCESIDNFQYALRIKIPASLYLNDYEDFTLIHIKDTGERVEHPFEIDGDYLVFKTNGLSDWAILGSRRSGAGAPNTGFGPASSDTTEAETSTLLVAVVASILSIGFVYVFYLKMLKYKHN